MALATAENKMVTTVQLLNDTIPSLSDQAVYPLPYRLYVAKWSENGCHLGQPKLVDVNITVKFNYSSWCIVTMDLFKVGPQNHLANIIPRGKSRTLTPQFQFVYYEVIKVAVPDVRVRGHRTNDNGQDLLRRNLREGQIT